MIELSPRRDDSECSLLVPPFVALTSAFPEESERGEAASAGDLPCVPGYRILAELGEGGMGIVYKAEQLRLKRLVALKMIRPARASRKLRERFHREAEAVARLQHANIVQIYEIGDHAGCPFLSLEYVEGGSLADQLDGRPLDPRQAAALLLLLAGAIHYAHDKGIIHRDLKPANILLANGRRQPVGVDSQQPADAGRSPKIADFGLAKDLDDDLALSREGDLLGTPAYMAPEQAGGRASLIGPATDVYALGAILYELLTGRPPFLAATIAETLKQVCEQDAVPPRQMVGRLPRDLDTICLKCLEKDPARRYSSAAALADDVRRFLDGEAIQARPIGRLEVGVRWMRRHPAAATLFGCLLLVLLGLALAIPFQIHLLNARVRAGTEEIHRLNRENLRVRVLGLLQQGRNASERNEWADARMRFTEIVDHLDAQSALLDDELRRRQEEARAELATADRRLAENKSAVERRHNYRELFRWRDEAFFLLNRDLFTPADSSPSESIEAAQRGLRLFGMADETIGGPELPGYSAVEKEEIRGVLFELVLIEAEGEARKNEQVDRSLTLLKRAAHLSADSSIVHSRRARYLRQQRRVGAGSGDPAPTPSPRTALGWFLRGYDLGLDESHRGAAILAFDEALRCRGDLFWAHFLRALAYQKQGQPSEARASLTVCVARRADFVWNYLLRGLVFIELGDLPAAKADFDKAESLALDAAARYVLHLNRGTLSLRERKPAEAIGHFEKAVHDKPQGYQAAVNLAEAHGQLQQFDEAIRWLNRAIRLEANNAALYRARALIEQRRGHTSAALANLDEALRRLSRQCPPLERARYHFERGAILFLDNQFRAALQAFDDSLAVWPKSVADSFRASEGTRGASAPHRDRDRLRANTHLLRAQALLKLNDPKNARAAFDAYLKNGPATANVWRQRAAVDQKLEDYNGVLEDCSRALGLEKDDADTLCLRGCAYLHFHLAKSARRDFAAALRLQPQHVEALLGRGLARVRSGDIVHGVEDARQAVKLKSNAPDVKLRAARVFAQAVAAEPQQMLDYESEALRLLRQAVELIRDPEQRRAFWSVQVRRDDTLTPIARGVAFRALDQWVDRAGR